MEGQTRILTLPNVLTLLRIVGALCLIFLKPVLGAFLFVYLFCGITDILDGVIARATDSTSALGKILDSIADLFFYGVMLIKLFPKMYEILPKWIWLFVIGIILLRVASYTIAFVKTGKFSAVHNVMNKVSGFFVFLVPAFILFEEIFVYYAISVCAVTCVAGINELFIHIRGQLR